MRASLWAMGVVVVAIASFLSCAHGRYVLKSNICIPQPLPLPLPPSSAPRNISIEEVIWQAMGGTDNSGPDDSATLAKIAGFATGVIYSYFQQYVDTLQADLSGCKVASPTESATRFLSTDPVSLTVNEFLRAHPTDVPIAILLMDWVREFQVPFPAQQDALEHQYSLLSSQLVWSVAQYCLSQSSSSSSSFSAASKQMRGFVQVLSNLGPGFFAARDSIIQRARQTQSAREWWIYTHPPSPAVVTLVPPPPLPCVRIQEYIERCSDVPGSASTLLSVCNMVDRACRFMGPKWGYECICNVS
jgi:hypothetical protein